VDAEWDPHKAHLNHKKHGVRFPDAVAALEDERALTIRDLSAETEERWITMGLDALGRLLVVVYTWRGDQVRIISARKANAAERAHYADAS
jgi:hypothetical protein